MFFSEEFINEVEENPYLGLEKACKLSLDQLELLDNGQNEWTEVEHEFLWECASFINLVITNFEIPIAIELPEPLPAMTDNCMLLRGYLSNVHEAIRAEATLLKIETYTRKYNGVFKNSFAYEFSQGDLDRVQILINELRQQLTTFEGLEASHRQRLLKRLEKLQSELHKKVSDLDRFWGLIGDAGVVIGKFGTDAKPIVDRIKEIAEIAWNTQSRTESLPSNTPNPMIGSGEEL